MEYTFSGGYAKNPKFEEATGGPLKPGIKVLLRARAEFDMHFGFSLNVVDIDPAYTLGDLAAKFRQIRAVLQREHLYDRNRTLPTPAEFVRVAVISPETSAGLGDFRAEVDRLQGAGLCHFRFVTATFQGPDTPLSIEAALRAIQAEHEVRPYDALVIIRGGGAAVDLSWLNDLELARTLCNAPCPVSPGSVTSATRPSSTRSLTRSSTRPPRSPCTSAERSATTRWRPWLTSIAFVT